MTSISGTRNQRSIALVIGTLLLASCSGSDNAQSNGAETDGINAVGANTSNNSGTTGVASYPLIADTSGTEPPVTNSQGSGTAGSETLNNEIDVPNVPSEFNDDGENSDTPSTGDTGIDNSPADGVQPDPAIQNTTRVDFEITVPAYASELLQLDVAWGDKKLASKWVGDEYWTASDTFPTNATLPLVVTFTDRNRDIVLSTYETDFKTGTNASEIFTINADQFDSAKWDVDNDGVSNLSESIAGTNPLIAEMEALEVKDSYYSGGMFGYQAQEFETQVPSLPYFEDIQDVTPLKWNEDYSRYTRGLSDILTIDLDENGTGTFYDYYKHEEPSDVTVETTEATRTNTGTSIMMSGSYIRTNSGAGVRTDTEYTIETKVIDQQTRIQTGTNFFDSRGYGDSNKTDTSYTLTGSIIDNSNMCKATSGNLSSTFQLRYVTSDNFEPKTTTVSKEPDDEYWYVSVTTPNGSVVDEYLAQSLGRQFYCSVLGL